VHPFRLILVCLLVVLPLQWSWATVARVCQHEVEVSHFGHHQHEHAADEGDEAITAADDTAADTALQAHPDCSGCQGMGAIHLPAALPPWPRALTAGAPPAPLLPPARAQVDDLLRPPQSSLA